MTPEQLAAIANPSAFIVCYARCWACMCLSCPGGMHDWADVDDIEHAAKTGRPSPVGQRCGCTCVDGPIPEPPPDGPDMDEPGPLFESPCKECGELGACGYDSEGRALVHVDAAFEREDEA